MLRIFRLFVSVTCLLLVIEANADWIEDSDKNAMLVLESQARFQPESIARDPV